MVPPWAPSELSAASFRAWNTDSYGPPEAGLTAPPLPPRWNGPTVDISLFRGTGIRPTESPMSSGLGADTRRPLQKVLPEASVNLVREPSS